MLIDATKSQLLVIDVQEKLAPAMDRREEFVKNTGILVQAARQSGMPATLSEQYPKGLGHTIADVAELAIGAPVLPKIEFSCFQNAGFRAHVERAQRHQLIIAGIEAHICVLQTAIDFAGAGFDVFVVADAVSSRAQDSKTIALRRMAGAGVTVVTTEMVVFEWLRTAEAENFRDLSRLIR